MTLDAKYVAGQLGKMRTRGVGEFSCLCPAHEDNNPSLAIKDSDNGIVVFCHAGCSQADVIAALSERNLWPSSRLEERTTKKRSTSEPR